MGTLQSPWLARRDAFVIHFSFSAAVPLNLLCGFSAAFFGDEYFT